MDGYLAEGYRRIKLKIEPGTDVERVRAVREAHPDILLSVDANAAYRLEDLETFLALDAFGLLMVEQPLHFEDLVRHAELQRAIRTDVCLDESIRSAADAEAAIELGACRIVNVKQGRVGGLLEARRVHDVARLPRRPRVVRRDARDGDRTRRQPRARRDAELPPPRRHQREPPLLRPTTSPSRSSWPPTARWRFPTDRASASTRGPDRLAACTLRVERVRERVTKPRFPLTASGRLHTVRVERPL